MLIQWPIDRRAMEVMEGFVAMKGFPHILGAIDGCHIPIKALNFCPENYVNRKGFHSVILYANYVITICSSQIVMLGGLGQSTMLAFSEIPIYLQLSL